MLSLTAGYARLQVPKDEDFARVAESIRTLLYVCRLNGLRGALVVSAQDGFDWRSSLRIALRFVTAGTAEGTRLALVAGHFNDSAYQDVLDVARSVGMECQVFRREPEAIDWLRAVGGEAARA